MDGVSTIKEYIQRSKEIGVPFQAVSDHGSLVGSRELIQVCKEENMKAIVGMEGYFTWDISDRTPRAKRDAVENSIYYHMLLTAKNENGLKNLSALNEVAWSNQGFYEKPRFDLSLLDTYKEDIIVSSACMGGVLCRFLENGLDEKAYEHAGMMKEMLGENYYVEIMETNGATMNHKLLSLADSLGIPVIVTDDCHHANKSDYIAQEAMLILSSKPKINENFDWDKSAKMDLMERFNYLYPDRKMTFQDMELYLHSGDEVYQWMKRQGLEGRTDALSNTWKIAESIGEYPSYEGLDLLPKPAGDADSLLRAAAFHGLRELGWDKRKEYVDRLNYELSVIVKKDFSTYFLLVQDIVDWAKSQGILVGPGRGSAAGSLLCRVLGITLLDPIERKLLFERFLDESRPDWPDIDIDFEDSRRGEVVDYAERKFGNLGKIMTFQRFGGKSLIDDAARAVRVPYADTEEVKKKLQVDGLDPDVAWDVFKTTAETAKFRKKYPEVVEIGDMLLGRTRSRGVHASGVVLSNITLSDIVPIESAEEKTDAGKSRIPVITADMKVAEKIGLIKMDFLGLKTLSVIGDCVREIEKRHGVVIDPFKLPLNDPQVFQAFRKGNTAGLFQAEGSAFTNILDQMPIQSFDDIVAATSLIRPGAADSRFGKQYLDFRLEGKRVSIHPDADWVIEETSGVLYQEQVMQLCVALAGMTGVESNAVRRAIGKKKKADLDLWSERFIDGAAKKIGPVMAAALWKDIEAAANYQFNKSHADAYSINTYVTAYLKTYYPLEFYLSIIRREKDKDKKVQYMIEAKRNGIEIRPPHVNHSDVDFSIKDGYLAMGLSDVKYVGKAAAKKIVEHAPFLNYQELKDIAGQKFSGINSRVLDSLDKVGGVVFPDNPVKGDELENFYEYLNIPSFNLGNIPQRAIDRMRTTAGYDKNSTFVLVGLVQDVVRKNGWARADIIDEDGDIGLFFDQEEDIQKGKYYIFLVANGSILRFYEAKDLLDSDDPLALYLQLESMTELPENQYRVIAFRSRTTKNKKVIGTLVVTDSDFKLHSFMVFSTKIMDVQIAARPGALVKVIAKQTKDGTDYVESIRGIKQ